ncbi:unnamed protein product [Durusdinium trenchii]|uniref:Uncharacterized protein n=2 Tax=Durusdinium trenchii TaxID=1381693 RepID=A0ABP0RB17_9DINO
MTAAAELVVPDILVGLDTSNLRGLLEAILARLRQAELQLTQREFEVQDLQEREVDLSSRLTKLEEAFAEEMDDGPALPSATVASATSLTSLQSPTSPRTPGGGLTRGKSKRFLDWEIRMDDLEKMIHFCEGKQKTVNELVEQLRDDSARREHMVKSFDIQLRDLRSSTHEQMDELLAEMKRITEATSEYTDDIQNLKVKLQAAQNLLDRIDMAAFRQELDDVAKRLETRLAGRVETVSADSKRELERNRLDLEKAISRCRSQLNDLVEGALENLRYSLGQKVLMLNPEEGVAAGTSKHCISCFKDRSQSPVRGSVGSDGHLYPHPAEPAAIPEEGSPEQRNSPLISTLLATRERARPLRPVSARGRKPERYDTVLDSYSRMLARANEKTLGKLVGVAQ